MGSVGNPADYCGVKPSVLLRYDFFYDHNDKNMTFTSP